MKKAIFLFLIFSLAFTFIACSKKSGGNANNSTTQSFSTNSATSTPSGNNSGSAQNVKDNNAIEVKEITRGYDGNSEEAFIQINFGRASFAKVELAAVSDVNAETAGFSTTGNFKLTEINVFSDGVTVNFNGTMDNYSTIPDITYTMPPEPVLKDKDGTPLQSFSYKLPYRNFDLFK